ncbi:MAG: MFS transporter [Novosphingobium sp. 17-62-19]|uniref:sugar porter family MFS transporter n=1 Tax=Novosphingobium sp. 17-62-19 TaxID=1970406 RepID=UPI000BC48E19|nr:sugar porter family MFS transporter [Novosphingobium sp. 17-62-19]OYX94542.1 MAG: MFS transporter [Novosphingobium sp. 35-62-5]OZA21621.1 MAG: MFS transporter [Novosphingobium sp. 17-62-19]HQS95867.1 sugar porter family MFS transporter [Novosphingobium sp.]
MAAVQQDRVNMALVGAIVAVATIGGLLFGYDSGAVNGTQSGLKQAFALDENGLGFTVGSLLMGCAAGAFLAGRMADRFGRKRIMMLSAVLFLIGALVQGLTDSHTLFVIARFFGGMAVGAASVLSPAYISEVAPAAIRGRLTSVQQVMIITGLTLAFVVNYVLAQQAGDSLGELAGYPAWRWMYLAQAVPAVVFLVALQFIPESPRYLVSSRREDEARVVLTRLFGETEAARKVEDIRASFATDHRPRLADVLAPGTVLRPIVWAGLIIALFQQFVGINVIFYYGETLWKLAGVSEKAALERNIISGIVSIAACLLAMALVDKIGRKPLLLIGSAGMTLSLGAMSWAFSQGTLDASGALQMDQQLGFMAVIAANIYVIFFNASWGPVMWVMLGEMFPNQLRGSALAVCGLAQWVANYAVVQSFPAMASGLGLAETYVLYTISAFVSFWLVKSFLPETKGKELEQMEGWGGH